jgi:hypothetical protein
MLVRFSSTATQSVTMFGDAAKQLIKMMGASGNVPGAMSAHDLPAALRSLKTGLKDVDANDAPAGDENDQDKDDKSEREHTRHPVTLRMRAGPLIDILERAVVKGAPVIWEAL